MKCTIPEISWHNRDPVLSIDVQPSKTGTVVPPYRLATGGTDSHVVIWYVTVNECGLASVEVAADLQRHQRAVNTVRFSPSGQYLASGDDESVIIVWKPKTEHDISDLTNAEGEVSKEQWVSMKILRGHLEDVYDISWSQDSVHLISGSIDNTAIIWDVQKGRNLGLLTGHSGFVQGVAWDPKNRYAATLSSDRTCRIHNISTNKVKAKVSKAPLPVPPGSELSGKIMRLFHDDTLKSFFRRLSFSPDGELLVTPSGVLEIPNSEKHISATYIFSRYDFSKPVVYLPSPREYTVAVRFCPLLFKLREGSSLFALPYRMVFAVATKSNVILYDTQQPEPIALISNIHYTRLTDLSWSNDGRVLIASSTDGYCSIITFSEEELGEIYELSSVNTESENECPNPEKRPSESPQVSSQAPQDLVTANTVSGPIKQKVTTLETKKTGSKTPVTPTAVMNIRSENEEKNSGSHLIATPVKDKKSPRRIALITLSSPRKRVTSTPASDSKKSTSGSVQSKVTTTTHDDDDDDDDCKDQSEAVKHANLPKTASDGTCSREGNSSEVTQAAEDETEPMQTDEIAVIVSSSREEKVVSQEIAEEPMELETTTSNQVGSPEKLSKGVEEGPNSSKSAVEVKSESHKRNSEENNMNKKDDGYKSEGCKESSLKKDLNDHEADVDVERSKVESKVIKGCETSPEKMSAVNSCETTPSKLLTDKMATEYTGTPSRVSDEASQQKVSRNVTPVEKRTPRRVQFITISSPKSKKKLM